MVRSLIDRPTLDARANAPQPAVQTLSVSGEVNA